MENPTLGCGPLYVRSSEMCRLCMKTHEYYLNIFVFYEELKTSIGKAIEDLLILKVAKNDNLPEMVCCPCVTKLMEFREFKEMCMNSAREFGRLAPVDPITCPVKDEFLPMQLLGEATSGMWKNSLDGEHRGPVAPNDLSRDTYASENQSDTKEVCPTDPLGESDACGEEDFAETECSEDAAVCRESKPILIHEQGEVKKELELPEGVGNVESHGCENIDEGDSSDTGGPILLSDILAVMGMVDCCNNIGKLTLQPGKESDKFGADKQWISESEVLNDPSCDFLREENLQLEHSMANSFVFNYLPQERVKIWKKNVRFYASSKKQFSQLNDRARPLRNQEREQLCNQPENANYPTDYICNYCSTRYLDKKSLAVHIKSHVDEIRSKRVLPKKDIPPRFSENHLGKAINCNECGKKSSTKRDIGRHVLVHSGEKPFKCNECGKMFTERGNLKKHSAIHTGVKRFKCNECGKMFTQRGSLKTHSLIHTGVKRFKCNECGKMISTKGNLKKHSLVHIGLKPFKCNECGKMFSQSCHLKSHSVIHTGVKGFNCNECGKMFTRKSYLKTHSLVHTGVKPFECNECGKMFTQNGNLKKHSLVHTGVKPFKCNECGKRFTTKGHLKTHSDVHTGVKPFKCDDCGNMFSRKGDLKTHSFVHTGVKPFKCNECGKRFTTKGHLNTHSHVHTGVKPFKCNDCGNMFTRKWDLKTHSFVHTGVKPFKCNECGKRFTTSCNLRRHLLVHTGVR